MKPLRLLRIAQVLSACSLVFVSCDDVIRDEGDVMLAAIFDVNEGKSDGTCGAFDLQDVRYVYAVQWFVHTLNQHGYIPGVKIGLETWRTCNSDLRAAQAAFHLMETYVTNSSGLSLPLAGVVGPSRTESAAAVSQLFSSLPEHQRVPQISGSATGTALGDRATYPSFFRVIPPDSTQIQVIRKLLLQLHWNYIAIIFTDDKYGEEAATALLQEVELHSICVPVFASVPMDTTHIGFTNALSDIVDKLNGHSLAGVSSAVRGAVFIGGHKQAQQFAAKLDRLATFVEIIFSEALGLQLSAVKKDNTDTVIGVAKGALTVTPMYREVPEFRQAWNELWVDCSDLPSEVTNNTWLTGVKNRYSGDCTQLLLEDTEQMLFTWYHIQAAAMLAAAIKSVHSEVCGNVPGPCPGFLSRVKNYEHIKNIWRSGLNLEAEFRSVTSSFIGMRNISFNDRGEVVTSTTHAVYEVHNIRTCLEGDQFCFVKVGTYTDGRVSVNEAIMYGYDSAGNPQPWTDVDKAQCGANTDCLECIPRKLCDATLVIPGDFYFVAVAPVHSRDPDDPLECGNPRANLGADFVQAIQFALEEVNKEGGRWRREMGDKRLGAIIFDSCYSQLVVKYKLLQLHKGHIMTPTGPVNETHVKNVLLKRIAGYIGGFFSVISFAMSDILTNLDRKAYIHLSPTSVAPGLSDRDQHPHFMRLTVPANSEILAILDLLKILSATYVQILFDPVDDYSADLTKEFEDKAADYGVCVAQKIHAKLQSDPNHFARILGELRQQSSARMVIVILQYEQILQVMDYLIGDGNHLQEEDNFVFLGSEAWARRPQIIQGKQRLAGSITVAEEIAVDRQFTSYFRTVDPLNTTNFWLRDYWEARGDCYFDLSFQRKGRSQECSPVIQESYSQDPWVSYYIQAVYAFASGVGKALSETCPRTHDDICPALTAEVFVDYMKQVKLDLFSLGEDKRVFDANGDGENGYKFMQAYWDPDSSAMKYRQIGTWTVGRRLSLSVPVSDLYTKLPVDIKSKNYNSSCSNQVECQICRTAKSEKVTDDDERSMAMVPAVVVMGVLGLLLVIAIVVIILLVRLLRLQTHRLRSNMEIRFENDGQSTLSSLANQPVQEMCSRMEQQLPPLATRDRLAVPPDSQGAQEDDYEYLNPANKFPHRPPLARPCGQTAMPAHPPMPCSRKKNMYLTGIRPPDGEAGRFPS